MTWTLRDAKQDQEIVDKIDAGDDRSAAILAEAFLEDRLAKCLFAHLKDDNNVIGRMFKGYGPLASFRAKLDLAYLMDIINERELKTLDRVREIRNRFAHRLEAHSFDVPMIKDLCPHLLQHDQVKGLCVHLIQEFEDEKDVQNLIGFWLVPMVEGVPDTPRHIYMNTIKVSIFMLELKTDLELGKQGKERLHLTMPMPRAFSETLLGKSEQQPPPPPQSEDRDTQELPPQPEPSQG